MRRSSKAQPFVMLTVTAAPEDYASLGFTLKSKPKSAVLSSMADTGCQSCLGGVKLLSRIGHTTTDLIPVSMKMHAANEKGIHIIGAVILRFMGNSANGESRETRQITYITNNSDKLFLSREACIALGMISKTFPSIGEIKQVCSVTATLTAHINDADNGGECSCPLRQMPPNKPTRLPFPATEANRLKLEKYLLKYYSSSSFNTCGYQQLPMMSGPPLRLMIDQNATPVAYHTPIPIPIHWQEDWRESLG